MLWPCREQARTNHRYTILSSFISKSDLGSGKTAAFVIPMLQKLKKHDTRGIRALLISPTRELALQTFKVVKELGRFTGLRCACLVGGDSIEDQFTALHENPDM